MQRTGIVPFPQGEYTFKHNVPGQLTPLLGREQDVASVCTLLGRAEVRLLTLVGTAGVGKTRLALQVAIELGEDFADGVYFVSLAPIADPDYVVPTIAQVFELREVGSQSLLDTLKAYLQDKEILLLLDNFEQIVAAALLIADLLLCCPRLKVLVTSREVLHLSAEYQFPVAPLALPDLKHLPTLEALPQYAAVALFVQRARAVRPDFALTATNARIICEICTRIDGLPLAIELAAARSKLLSPQALLARLEQRLQVLTRGAQDLPERQQTLRNTISWSYSLLNANERRLFRLLSVFVSGCTFEAVDAVCRASGGVAGDVLDGVASLLDKSILSQGEQDDGEQENRRLYMLETIREYGLECLEASGEAEATRYAHACYYVSFVKEAEVELGGAEQARWLERLEREHDNLRAVMQWSLEDVEEEEGRGRIEMALQLGGALRRFWIRRGHYTEGRHFLERLLGRSSEASAFLRAKALLTAARLALGQGDYERGEELCEESLALCREIGDKPGTAFALFMLGWVAWEKGSAAAACALNEESLILYKELGDTEGVAFQLDELARMFSKQGDYARARAFLEESLTLHRSLGNKKGIAASLYSLADTLFASQGDPMRIRSLIEECMATHREVGDMGGVADCLYLLGQVTLGQGDAARAHSLLEESLALYKERGYVQDVAEVLLLLARTVATLGDLGRARALYEESLAICQNMGYSVLIAPCLEGLAGVVAAQGQVAWAARLWGAAEALREAIGMPLPPVERSHYEQAVASTRTWLGERLFAKMWAEGRTMAVEGLRSPGEISTLANALLTPPEQTIGNQQVSEEPRLSSTNPAGLTARELEVLRLVVEGLTNSQIAERLIISPHTANAHVRSIFNKLEVSSRSGATRYAVEHHLV